MANHSRSKMLQIFKYLALLLTLPMISEEHPLRFGENGRFKILQVADMHYGNGKTTPCLDVLPDQFAACSDLNTTSFMKRLIRHERPDLIVFTGDNIFGFDAADAKKSLDAAFAPAISSNIPWAAVLGNHDQESTLSREGVMQHIARLKNALSQVNPEGEHLIEGFGNYNLEVHGVKASKFENKSVLNLYFLDSGDYSTASPVSGYGWIKITQQLWFQKSSHKVKRAYTEGHERRTKPAPGLAFFHIPLPEFAAVNSNITGVRQEDISSASVNSGFFTTLVESGDVKAVFVGHDHLNDFCGDVADIWLCYAGGFGYHAYGQAGWPRRARVVEVSLAKGNMGGWKYVESIKTWKRLDNDGLSTVDTQLLWRDTPSVAAVRRKKGVYIKRPVF